MNIFSKLFGRDYSKKIKSPVPNVSFIGKPIYVNIGSNSPATIGRHLHRIATLKSTIMKEKGRLGKAREYSLVDEIKRRTYALAAQGIGLPNNIVEIRSLADKFLR